ncbi:hypothetical protein [Coleofasciculus sp. F4-SAH-05]|uniref:hypothetical protein n=1 Tax=Coleofasciculus sp. F4-SAH-05 TaxID=3069525 RepID=UPI0032F4DFE4
MKDKFGFVNFTISSGIKNWIKLFYLLTIKLTKNKKYYKPPKSPHLLRFVSSLCLILVFGLQQTPAVAQVTQAKVVEILGGNHVYIQNQPVQINAIATLGQTITTKQARVNLQFNNDAGVRLGQNSAITVGSRCARVRNGKALVYGIQGCVNSIVATTRGTVYLMELNEMGQGQIKVISGAIELRKRYSFLSSESVGVNRGEKIDIHSDGDLAESRCFSREEIEQIIQGELFEGFQTEISGL